MGTSPVEKRGRDLMPTSAVVRMVAGVALLVWAVVAFASLGRGTGPLLPAAVGAYLLIGGSPAVTTDAIVCAGLTKCFGDLVALDRVSFAVPAGQVVAVLGPNGAGKTTTMELLEGYQAPTAGTVRVLGADPRHGGRAWRARIGLVLQAPSLDEQLIVRELLGVFAQLYPDPRPVAEVLELLDLTDEAGVRVGALSGGQRRRVDVALGIIGRPELLFLDEPTTGLDPRPAGEPGRASGT
jgi:ABC-2 type transport system ATP-binding protein